jgi:stearoyl-CoA desaturase (delta-9 desaturase)
VPWHKKWANLVVILLGFGTLVVGAELLWRRGFTRVDLAIFIVMYALCGFGITGGYHRLLAHRSYEVPRWLTYLLAVQGSAAVQGPVIEWVSDHRKHHACSDRPGDPHSPHVGAGEGWKGFWHAHAGWLFRNQGLAGEKLYAPDLLADPVMLWIDRANVLFVILGLALPYGLGYLTGSMRGGVTGLLWGGFFRIALMHHLTFSVNSLCHILGSRPFRTSDWSGNIGWLALPTLGESWHQNHHAFPTSAFHGLRWWQFDPTAMVIRIMRVLGLAWNIVEVPVGIQRRKAA